MVFTGTYEHGIDAKNRLAVPADIRAQLQDGPESTDGGSVVWVVTLDESQKALCLYTASCFNQRADELDRSELDPDRLLHYERIMYSLAERVVMDRQGRIRLPERLLKRTGLGSDVVMIGVKDHLEVRDRESWLAYVEQALAAQPQVLMNPRRAMKQQAGGI